MGKKLIEIFKNFKGDKRILLIVLIGIVGILLLTLSEIIPDKDDEQKLQDNDTKTESITEYEQNLEKRLEDLLTSVDGAGKVRVMLTLDCGDESVYATENKSSEKSDEKSYVLIENDGENGGLLLKVSQPQVRGVAVVCEGADSAKVKQEITGTLTVVLGISTNRVNIAKMKLSNGG